MPARRPALLLVAAAVGLVVLPQADASPFAGRYRYLYSGEQAVTGADGARWVLSVFATVRTSAQSRTEQRLYVDLSRCASTDACQAVGRWSRPLADGEVSVPEDYGSGTLRTTLAGQPLTVDLRSVNTLNVNSRAIGTPATAFTGLGVNEEEPSVSPDVVQYHGASGTLRLGRLACGLEPEDGELGEVTSVDTFGEDARYVAAPPAQLPTGLLKGPRAPRC